MNSSGVFYLRGVFQSEAESSNISASFLQSWFWGSFKARFGWKAFSFNVNWNTPSGEVCCALLVLSRRLAPGLSFAYVPWGPELPDGFPADCEARTQALSELAVALRSFLPKKTAFIRFDPPWYSEGAGVKAPSIGRPFVHASADIQAPDTVIIDLKLSEEEIFNNMKSKWRYNGRLALKKGVTKSRSDADNYEAGLDVFYSLLKMTAARDGIAVHDASYYKTLFSQCKEYAKNAQNVKRNEMRLYLAHHEGEALAAIIVLLWGDKATYLYGASSDNKRNLMAPYALQIQAMLDARSSGCVEYDLFGIPPSEDPSHPMAGLYRFKTGFGGKIIHRPGSWDYAYRPLAAGLFRAAETLRKSLRDRKKVKSHSQSGGHTDEQSGGGS